VASRFYGRMYFTQNDVCCLMLNFYRGGPLERGLQRVVNDAPMGSLLVQSDAKSGEPLLLHVMLPVCIRERHLAADTWVFLLDAQVCSSNVDKI
jgi:uracil phosphoribosyltransferase